MMTDIDFLEQASKRYSLEMHDVIKCLRLAIARSGDYGEISSEIKNGKKICFFEQFYNRFGELRNREIRVTRVNYQRILDRFIDNLSEMSIRQQIRFVRLLKRKNKAVSGKIVEIKPMGLKVLTPYGYGTVAKAELVKKELATKHYQIDKIMYFHIRKIKMTKGVRMQLILDRTHQSIALAEAQSVMADCGVYAADRVFGTHIKVYCTKKPSKEQIKTLAKQINERVVVELMR